MVMGKGGRLLSGQPWNAKELVRYQRTVFEYGGTSFFVDTFWSHDTNEFSRIIWNMVWPQDGDRHNGDGRLESFTVSDSRLDSMSHIL